MTSSLVGSEMCIRDRHLPQLEVQVPSLLHDTGRVAARWFSTGVPKGTVSYTHLTLPTICSV
eukprot:3274050-Prorocentrum_lima.AAC.1